MRPLVPKHKLDFLGIGGTVGDALSTGLSAVPGIGTYLGAQQTNAANQSLQDSANAASQASVQQQEQYQTMMSDTADQRGVADAKAAGLNPLAITGVGPASSPQGGSASMKAATMANPAAGVSDSISNAMSTALQAARTKSDIDKNTASIANTQADTINKSAQTDNITSDTALKNANTKNIDYQNMNAAPKAETQQYLWNHVKSLLDQGSRWFNGQGGAPSTIKKPPDKLPGTSVPQASLDTDTGVMAGESAEDEAAEMFA